METTTIVLVGVSGTAGAALVALFYYIYNQLATVIKTQGVIMATQEEFNSKIADINSKLDSVQSDVVNIQSAVAAEAQQISDFIASLPASSSIDTSALDGVVSRLEGIASDAASLADSVGGIFTPPSSEPAPTGEPAPESPAEPTPVEEPASGEETTSPDVVG